jgi:hypothetical protein
LAPQLPDEALTVIFAGQVIVGHWANKSAIPTVKKIKARKME